METKICTKCNLENHIDFYHKEPRNKDGLSNQCNSCKKEYDRIYRQSNKIQKLYKGMAYKNKKALASKERREKYPERLLFLQARVRSKKYNLPFNLEESDIVIPQYCPLLGIELKAKEYGAKGSFTSSSPSLDKIVPELGYVKDNIMVISMKANSMKSNATLEELLTFAENSIKIYTNLKNKNDKHNITNSSMESDNVQKIR